MLIRRLWCVSGLIAAGGVLAAEPIQPAMMDNDALAFYMPDGAELETRLDTDFTGDGLRDLAFVARNDDTRQLIVMVAYASDVDVGYDPAGKMPMGVSPLGAAGLSTKKGVLIVEDLDGGTTAIQSLYRLRYDPKQRRMRLIGDDVTFYSRTQAHGSLSVSTNRLTGERVIKRRDLVGDTFTDRPELKRKLPAALIWMERAPLPETTIDQEQ